MKGGREGDQRNKNQMRSTGMADLNKTILIITFTVKELALHSKDRLSYWVKKASSNCVLSTGHTSEIQGHRQTESQSLETDTPCKQ